MSGLGFVKLPTGLLYDPEVPDGVLRAYMALARYAISCSRDTFELTTEALGTLLGRSRNQAMRRLSELQSRGLIVVDGNRGRARPNLITVLDPQEVVFAGLHVERAAPDPHQQAAPEVVQPAAPKMGKPYLEGREDERGQRSKRTAPLPSPVDNGGASRPPRPRCEVHEPPGSWSDSRECRGCVADRKAATGPPF